jgi:hypothetical protein
LEKKNTIVYEAVHMLPDKLHTDARPPKAACELLNSLVNELNMKFTTDLGGIIMRDVGNSDSDNEIEKPTIIFIGSVKNPSMAETGRNPHETIQYTISD